MAAQVSVIRLALAWLALILLGLELGLRALGYSNYWAFARYPDHHRGYAPMPGTRARQALEGDVLITINRFGFRDREWGDKADNAYRIAVLGDSFTAAVQVPLETTWWRQAEQLLHACGYRDGLHIEIMNFAVSGYGTAQQLETLRHHVPMHRPDEIWLAFFPGNDVSDNHPQLSDDPFRPYLRHGEDGWQLQHAFRSRSDYRRQVSPLGRFYYHYLLRLRSIQAIARVHGYFSMKRALAKLDKRWFWEPGIDVRVYAPPQHAEWAEAWQVTRALLRMIGEQADTMQTPLRVLGLATGAQVHPDAASTHTLQEYLDVPDLLFPNWQVAQFAAMDGYGFIDLAAPMAELARADGVFFHGVDMPNGLGHWNADGHAAAARLLAERLCASPHARPITPASGG